jgi:MOSC domain-containing protein YiiM
MKLISVNIGVPREIIHRGQMLSTGIFKTSVAGSLFLRRLNLDGDRQADLRVHGGADKAVYLYPFEHYDFWAAETGRNDFVHGQFGENFTTTGLLEDEVRIGDVLQIGAARVQVSQPRSPCYKLGIRMGDEEFPARFAAANRTGFYLRVLEEGWVQAGDAIRHLERAAGSLSVREVFFLRHANRGTREEYARAARLPGLSESWRAAFAKRAAEIQTAGRP